jgi:hypothetical protein
MPGTPDIIVYIVSTLRVSVHPHHLQRVLSFYFAKVIKFIRLPVDDTDALKHVGVLNIYKILLIFIYCAFVDLVNKLYKMYGTYIKITIHFFICVVYNFLYLVLDICLLLLHIYILPRKCLFLSLLTGNELNWQANTVLKIGRNHELNHGRNSFHVDLYKLIFRAFFLLRNYLYMGLVITCHIKEIVTVKVVDIN